jgi:hypothetical protein
MLKRLSLTARISLIISGLLAISTLFSVKIPHFVINSVLADVSPSLVVVAGDIHFNWRRGQLDIRSLVINDEGVRVAAVERGRIDLIVNPISAGFLSPTLIELSNGEINISPQVHQTLSNLMSTESDLLSLSVTINNIDVSVSDGTDMVLDLVNIGATASLDGENGVIDLRCDSLLPAAGSIEILAHTTDKHANWSLWSTLDGNLANEWSIFRQADFAFTDGVIKADLQAAGDWNSVYTWALNGEIELAKPKLSSPTLSFDKSAINFAGSSASGIRVNATTDLLEQQVRSTGELSFYDHEGFNMRLVHSVAQLPVNQQLRSWVAAIEPEIATYLTATQAGGSVYAQTLTEVNNTGFLWAIAISPLDLNIAYAGLTSAVDSHFSFPYPATLNNGYIALADDALLLDCSGSIGDGTLAINGDIDFELSSTAVDLDINAKKIDLDKRIPHALSGNPSIDKLWRDLGSPTGGHVDAFINVFTLDDDGINYSVDLDVFNCTTQPAMLPLEVAIKTAEVNITSNLVNFSAVAVAAQSNLKITGSSRSDPGSNDAQIRVSTSASGWHPNSREAAVMSSYLPIPAGLASFPISGGFTYDLQLLWPTTSSAPHLYANLSANNSRIDWPLLGVKLDNLITRNSRLFAAGDFFKFNIGYATATIEDGAIQANCNISHSKELNLATVNFNNLPINNSIVLGSQKFSEQEIWGEHLDWNGATSGTISFNPLDPNKFAGEIDLAPLTVNSTETPDVKFSLRGNLELLPTLIRAEKLVLQSPNSELLIHQLRGEFSDEGLRASAILESNTGLQLNSNLPALAGSDFASSIEKLGLSGEMYADGLEIDVLLTRDGHITADFSGDMNVQDVNISKAIPLTDGSAQVDIENAWWRSTDEFGATMSLSEGTGLIDSMQLSNAIAKVTIDGERLQCTELTADLLDGKIEGSIDVGFSDSTPVGIHTTLSDIDLGLMREQLNIVGALSGKVSGRIDLDSPSPSPTFCKGSVTLEIKDGILGSVPILKTIWILVGLPAPIIDKGNLDLEMNGTGTISVNSFSLDGNAFEFTGKGTANMDASINLKVTARTLGLITRLPLVKDLLDLFIEQQIYGPVESPQIAHRAWAKITNNDFARPPFPLWIPSPGTPDWNISPVIPVQ